MLNIFGSIEEDGESVLELMKIDITGVRVGKTDRTTMSKRAVLFCYLKYHLNYRTCEIADYAHKERSSITRSLKVYKRAWEDNRTELLYRLRKGE